MEPGDAVELAKTGGNSVAGFTIGHMTGNDLVVIGTLIYLACQLIVLAPKVWDTIRRWLSKDKNDG
ncbi:hypothetical protein HOR67_gp09 [Ralstonia phage RS-PI-1]|uniref:Holin n=1 Tax=Ralstonia phage RS-PI-1 TaxID=1958965 RepID=A0A1S6L1B4_9CAUD|nr:hypothetical protein HOR67_gp09 [Ralstonia phage RS-PI-1]AQT27771.1 hypothetical protein [Ralstonia phage RS-PI-1]